MLLVQILKILDVIYLFSLYFTKKKLFICSTKKVKFKFDERVPDDVGAYVLCQQTNYYQLLVLDNDVLI